jgi:hypothetical protein
VLTKAIDTTFDPERSPKEARLATGSLLNLCDAVITGRVKNGFALIRPPGHHAEPDAAMGFCIYNNVGVAAKWVLQKYPQQVKRILIIDWDVQYQPPLFLGANLAMEMGRRGYFMMIRMCCIFLFIGMMMARSVCLPSSLF